MTNEGSGLTARATENDDRGHEGRATQGKPTADGKDSAPGPREGDALCDRNDRSDGQAAPTGLNPHPGQRGDTDAAPCPSTAGPRTITEAELRKIPKLAMRPEHGTAIIKGVKTSTLRTRPQPGRYRIEGRPKYKGAPVLNAIVELEYREEVWWPKLDEIKQQVLAKIEGYDARPPGGANNEQVELAYRDAVKRFLSAVRSIYGRGGVAQKWIDGERSLELHRIVEVEEVCLQAESPQYPAGSDVRATKKKTRKK